VFPINFMNAHWLTVVSCNTTRTLHLYDFLYPSGPADIYGEFHTYVLTLIEDFLNRELEVRGLGAIVWGHNFVVRTKLQEDGFNCGPLVCLVAWLTAWLERPPTEAELRQLSYNEAEMGNMRLWMAYSALTGRIWLPPVAENMTDALRPTYGEDNWGPVDQVE
jgi:hypothetical protein